MTATDKAWSDYQRVIDDARSRALSSSWASTPQLRAQAAYYISMLQAFGFNLYMAPRQAYPTFFSHTVFTPVEYQWGAPSPDFRYHWTAIDGARTYRIWGRRGNPRAVYIQMIYDLADDEALIIDCEIPDCKYWSLQLADPWFQTTDYRFHASSLNDKQARRDSDGRVRIVLSRRDAGVPNWVDTAGLGKGLGMWRWYLSPSHPVPATTKVRLAELREHLPPDTPHVSPAQRAEMLAVRQAQVARRFGF